MPPVIKVKKGIVAQHGRKTVLSTSHLIRLPGRSFQTSGNVSTLVHQFVVGVSGQQIQYRLVGVCVAVGNSLVDLSRCGVWTTLDVCPLQSHVQRFVFSDLRPRSRDRVVNVSSGTASHGRVGCCIQHQGDGDHSRSQCVTSSNVSNHNRTAVRVHSSRNHRGDFAVCWNVTRAQAVVAGDIDLQFIDGRARWGHHVDG